MNYTPRWQSNFQLTGEEVKVYGYVIEKGWARKRELGVSDGVHGVTPI